MKSELNISMLLHYRRRLFWVFLTAFWLVYWLYWFIMFPENQEHPFVYTALRLVGFGLSIALLLIYRKYNLHRLSLQYLIPMLLLGSTVAGVTYAFAHRALHYFLLPELTSSLIPNYSELMFLFWLHSFNFLLVSVIYIGAKFWLEWTDQQVQAEREHALAKSAQLESLKYQLKPHFLFNSLSSLRALVKIDPDRAESMITHISEFLRYSLLDGKREEVPLSKELEIIRLYLEIEKVRYEDDLVVEYQIDSKAENYPVPIFLLHPLVENAVKYGTKTSPRPLRITLKAERLQDELRLSIINTGTWMEVQQHETSMGTGTGLEIVRKRLEHLFPGSHSFSLDHANGFVQTTIMLKRSMEAYHGETISRTHCR